MSEPQIAAGELRALLDKQAITEVILSYSRAVDRGDEALLRACYHADAVEDHGGTFLGPAVDYIAAILPALHGGRLMTHTVTNILIELQGASAAVSECYYLSFARYPAAEPPFETLTLARAIDRFERRDGAWRIARRQLRWEWNREQPIAETWARGAIGDPLTLLRGGKAPDDVLYAPRVEG
ncbi:nuclear transport factor 2 family protein [Phenylobacterium sp.]|uniref:nuclear transport factor 2 family protein n=1 Tax=Phenylobacterium sp. TaxID=1871053 RepID=UPI00374DA904